MGVPTSPAAGRDVRQGVDKQTSFWAARSSTVGMEFRRGGTTFAREDRRGALGVTAHERHDPAGWLARRGSAMWWMWEVRGRRVARSLRQEIIGAPATLSAHLSVPACAPL